jgi:hypothetical protein
MPFTPGAGFFHVDTTLLRPLLGAAEEGLALIQRRKSATKLVTVSQNTELCAFFSPRLVVILCFSQDEGALMYIVCCFAILSQG